MPFPEVMSPVVEFVEIYLDKFVQWNVDHEWIGSQSLVFVTPGQGLDAKALELADLIGLDAGTMKVFIGSRNCAFYRLVVCRCSAAALQLDRFTLDLIQNSESNPSVSRVLNMRAKCVA